MIEIQRPSVTFEITEPREAPWLETVLGYVAMVPLAAGTLAFWLAAQPWRGEALTVTLYWGCAILIFLSGVRRGVSFRTPGGERAAQIVTMLWLFCLGFAAILSTAAGSHLLAAALLLAGYLSLEIFDPRAAAKLEAPLYFARLRPAQMAIPVVCLALTIVLMWFR